MALTDEMERLSALHASGSLTDDEFAEAKQKLLDEDPSTSPAASSDITSRLDELSRQNALLRLDHDWENEKQSYMMRGRYGSSYLPTTSGAIASGITGVALGFFSWPLAHSIPTRAARLLSSGSF